MMARTYECLPVQHISAPEYTSSSQQLFSSIVVSLGIIVVVILAT